MKKKDRMIKSEFKGFWCDACQESVPLSQIERHGKVLLPGWRHKLAFCKRRI